MNPHDNNDADDGGHDNDDQQQEQRQQQPPQAAIEEWSVERLSRADYKELGSPENVEQRFLKHLLANPNCRNSLRILLMSSSTTSRDYSLEIDAFDLLEADPVLGHLLLKFPSILSSLLENAIVAAQQELQRQIAAETETNNGNSTHVDTKNTPVVKGHNGSRVHARLIHLPPTCCKLSLASLHASDVGKIVQCSGTVVRVTPVCMYEVCIDEFVLTYL